MSGKNLNLMLSKIRTKNILININDYIKSSLRKEAIILFIISIIPFTISSLLIQRNIVITNQQKANLAFESKQNIILNKIENTIKQIAHTTGLKIFLQSSDHSRKMDKYKLLNRIEILLLHNHIIDGIKLYNLKNELILETGEESKTKITYILKFTNDFIDKYGTEFGKLQVAINKDLLLEELSSSYYNIVLSTNAKMSRPFIYSSKKNELLNIISNEYLDIYPVNEYNSYWLYYLLSIIILTVVYILTLKRTFNLITLPIKSIANSIFSKNHLTTNHYNIIIKELLWIKKIIDNIKITKLNYETDIYAKMQDTNKLFVDQLHKLKSNFSSVKILIDSELKNDTSYLLLNTLVTNSINNAITLINKYKNNSNYQITSTGLSFITLNDLSFYLKNTTLSDPNINVNNQSISYDNHLICISVDDLQLILSNIITNAYEANAKKIDIQYFVNENNLTILISNDGDPIELSNCNYYISGGSTKPLGTGTGLSSIKNILDNTGSKLLFVTPEVGFITTVQIDLNLLKNNAAYFTQYIIKNSRISELVIINNVLQLEQSDFNEKNTMISCINDSELYEYIELSTKSGIIFNQWYFIEHFLFNSSIKFNGSIIENNKVSRIINL